MNISPTLKVSLFFMKWFLNLMNNTVSMVRRSHPNGDKMFRIRPDRHWSPPSLLYKGYRASLSKVKRLWHGLDHPPPSNAEVTGRTGLYLYFPYGSLWPVLGWNLPLLCTVSISPVYENSLQTCDLREATLRLAGCDKHVRVTTLKASERVTSWLSAEGGLYLLPLYLHAYPI